MEQKAEAKMETLWQDVRQRALDSPVRGTIYLHYLQRPQRSLRIGPRLDTQRE